MRTSLSIAQNQALIKQKDRRTIFSLFQEYKNKKILESFYSEALLSIAHNKILVNKKDRETSINFVSYYVYFFLVILTRFLV